MVKVGKWIAKHKVLVLLIGLLLVIPSVIGIAETRVNYDLLSYLPDTLETVKGQDILLALVDWMLPGENGPDILRESRRKGIMTPVVMLTALTAVENKVTCLDAGADDYLGKPFDSRELLARVRANLRRPGPHRGAGGAAVRGSGVRHQGAAAGLWPGGDRGLQKAGPYD